MSKEYGIFLNDDSAPAPRCLDRRSFLKGLIAGAGASTIALSGTDLTYNLYKVDQLRSQSAPIEDADTRNDGETKNREIQRRAEVIFRVKRANTDSVILASALFATAAGLGEVFGLERIGAVKKKALRLSTERTST